MKEKFEQLDDQCYPKQPLYIGWVANKIGFGELYFYTKETDDGVTIYCDNELMNKEFIKRMLCKMVDDAVLTCPSQKDEK